MDKSLLYAIVTASSAAEGSSLNLEQNFKLFDQGVSSEGKTISEQLMNLDLLDAYRAAIKDAESHQVWSGYRIKLLAAKVFRNRSFDSGKVNDEDVLQTVCHDANEARMHFRSLGEDGLRKVASQICKTVSNADLWPEGNGLMGRLLANMIEFEFGLCPSIDSKIKIPKADNAIRILGILAAHPRRTTADLAQEIGISDKGVEKHLAKLKKNGFLRRIGPDKGGFWLVTGSQTKL